MILVDANVVIDALEMGSEWHDWSVKQITRASASDAFITYIVAAEVGGRVDSQERLRRALDALALPIREMDLNAAYLAGKAYRQWIKNGGRRGVILTDLLIGAHAASVGASILTRDARRFRTYFPELDLITPETRQ